MFGHNNIHFHVETRVSVGQKEIKDKSIRNAYYTSREIASSRDSRKTTNRKYNTNPTKRTTRRDPTRFRTSDGFNKLERCIGVIRIVYRDASVPVAEHQDQQEQQYQVPKPYEYVGLFVDYVQRQHAQRIVRLHRSGRPVLVERALGHPGKYVDHGIDPVVLVHVGYADDAEPVGDELSVEKSVHPVDLNQNVGQTHELASPILDGVPSVFLKNKNTLRIQ